MGRERAARCCASAAGSVALEGLGTKNHLRLSCRAETRVTLPAPVLPERRPRLALERRDSARTGRKTKQRPSPPVRWHAPGMRRGRQLVRLGMRRVRRPPPPRALPIRATAAQIQTKTSGREMATLSGLLSFTLSPASISSHPLPPRGENDHQGDIGRRFATTWLR